MQFIVFLKELLLIKKMKCMRNFLFFILLLGGLFSFVITNFVDFEENFELLLDNSGPYIGAEFPNCGGNLEFADSLPRSLSGIEATLVLLVRAWPGGG